eukprot:c25330_g1_i6 orf=90-2018(+)
MAGSLRALFLVLYSICGLMQFINMSWVEDDPKCLKAFWSSVHDPNKYLSNWDFTNGSTAPLCSFVGVTCWDSQENRVMSLKLEQAGLSGAFPNGLNLCSSLEGLSLAGNGFTGSIPNNLSKQMPYLSSLDLSGNAFEGSIPGDLGNCTYLNALYLQHNRLSGEVPWGLGVLPRLTDLDLSSNDLSGSIPSSFTNRSSMNGGPFDASTFANNPLLCGLPLSLECRQANSKSHQNQIVGGSIAGLVFLVALTLTFLWCRLWLMRKLEPDQLATVDAPDLPWWKRVLMKQACGPHHKGKSRTLLMFESHLKLTWQELQRATANFSPANIVGKGGSSTVYKGSLLNGRTLAIKVLHNDELGFHLHTLRQIFLTELAVLGKLRHRNLIRILGYFYNLESMAIIMDYMPGGSLAALLNRQARVSGCDRRFGWKARSTILLGIAEGLAYLHNEYDRTLSVIHGDVKPGNVLLDVNMEARIADFGIATFVSTISNSNSKSLSKGQVLPVPCWSLGYTAPECVQQGVVCCKSDMFSFGMIVLAIITGKEPNSHTLKEGETLVEWVSKALEEGVVECVIAPSLLSAYETSRYMEEIIATLRMGCRCASLTCASRPNTYKVVTFFRQLVETYKASEATLHYVYSHHHDINITS